MVYLFRHWVVLKYRNENVCPSMKIIMMMMLLLLILQLTEIDNVSFGENTRIRVNRSTKLYLYVLSTSITFKTDEFIYRRKKKCSEQSGVKFIVFIDENVILFGTIFIDVYRSLPRKIKCRTMDFRFCH